MTALIEIIKEITKKQNEAEIQQAEIIVNQEYANCLLELSQTIE